MMFTRELPAGVKFSPKIVISVSPVVGPLVGLIEVTTGVTSISALTREIHSETLQIYLKWFHMADLIDLPQTQ